MTKRFHITHKVKPAETGNRPSLALLARSVAMPPGQRRLTKLNTNMVSEDVLTLSFCELVVFAEPEYKQNQIGGDVTL